MEHCDLRLHIGERVRLIQDVENYPTIFLRAGETGLLARVDTDSIWVRLDKHYPELNEWENEIQIWDWSQSESDHPCDYIDFA